MLLLDEPLSALDAKIRVSLREQIRADPARARHHHRLRDPRPGRGAVDLRPHRRDERRQRRAVRHAVRDLQPPGDQVRRDLRRHAQHAQRARSSTPATKTVTIDGQASPSPPSPATAKAARPSRSPCGPKRCRSASRTGRDIRSRRQGRGGQLPRLGDPPARSISARTASTSTPSTTSARRPPAHGEPVTVGIASSDMLILDT